MVSEVPDSLRPLRRRAQLAVLGLIAVVVADLVLIWSDLRTIDLMSRLLDEPATILVELDALEANDDREAVVALVYFAALIAAIVLFIRWFHAAYANLRALKQPALRYRTGWAIGSWFVPFLNLWRPKQIANDIWRGSDPDAPAFTQAAWPTLPITPLLGAWWAAWIIGSLLSNAVGRAIWRADAAEDIRSAARFEIFTTGVEILAAVLAVAVVWKLTARQELRAQRVAAESAHRGTAPLQYDGRDVAGSSGQPG